MSGKKLAQATVQLPFFELKKARKRRDTAPKSKKRALSYSASVIESGFHRFYIADEEKFREALCLYNMFGKDCSKDGVPRRYECKGRVNVGMRMCSSCQDFGKYKFSKDLYYVDVNEIAGRRSILCHGCMGEALKKYMPGFSEKAHCSPSAYLADRAFICHE